MVSPTPEKVAAQRPGIRPGYCKEEGHAGSDNQACGEQEGRGLDGIHGLSVGEGGNPLDRHGHDGHGQSRRLAQQPGSALVLQKESTDQHQGYAEQQERGIGVAQEKGSGDDDEKRRRPCDGVVDGQIPMGEGAQQEPVKTDDTRRGYDYQWPHRNG